MPTGTVRLHRVLKAPPERVYRAFLEPAAMAKWLPPYGFTCTVHHMDPKVGGTYRMSFTNFGTGNGHSFGGEYRELVRGTPRAAPDPPLGEASDSASASRRRLSAGLLRPALLAAFTYFDRKLQREVAHRFLGALHPGGALVLGSHEELPAGVAGFERLRSDLLWRIKGSPDRGHEPGAPRRSGPRRP